MRRGSSLIEALLALVLLQFGLLATIAASAVASRDLAAANRRVRAQEVARGRVDGLRVNGCAAAAPGSMRWPGGIEEHWRIDAVGMLRVITDSVVMVLPRGKRAAHVRRGWVLCGS